MEGRLRSLVHLFNFIEKETGPMRSHSIGGHFWSEWEGLDTDPGLWLPVLSLPGSSLPVLNDAFVLASIGVILLIPLNIKNTLGF